MADSFGDSFRRDMNKYWAETRKPEVAKGKPWTAWDYVTSPLNTLHRAASEIAVDMTDPSLYQVADPDKARAEILEKARSRKDDLNAQNAWDLMLKNGTVQGY